MNSDGSGTWTRYDHCAVRFRPLWKSGPARAEITRRETFCAKTGEAINPPMLDFPTNRDLSACLPLPGESGYRKEPGPPRSIRTVFHFTRTESTNAPPIPHPDEVHAEGASAAVAKGLDPSWEVCD